MQCANGRVIFHHYFMLPYLPFHCHFVKKNATFKIYICFAHNYLRILFYYFHCFLLNQNTCFIFENRQFVFFRLLTPLALTASVPRQILVFPYRAGDKFPFLVCVKRTLPPSKPQFVRHFHLCVCVCVFMCKTKFIRLYGVAHCCLALYIYGSCNMRAP